MDEKAIWRRIQEGESLAFKTLFEAYYETLYYYTLQLTKDSQFSQDLVQETFIKLWEKKNEVEIKTSLKSYLFRIGYNLYIDEKRKEKRNDLLLIELKYESLIDEIECEDSRLEEKINKVKYLVNTLPKKCKEILLLSKKEGLKNKEIAIKLNISIKTVESQISIAFKKIRKNR